MATTRGRAGAAGAMTWIIVAFAALAMTGCTTQLVSNYDAETEQQITSIQKQVEGLLERIQRGIGTDAADYDGFSDTYRELAVAAQLLDTRAEAIDNNSITAQQTELLIGWLGNLEQLHAAGIDSSEIVGVLRAQSQQIFVAMLKFELAKKREFDSVDVSGEK